MSVSEIMNIKEFQMPLWVIYTEYKIARKISKKIPRTVSLENENFWQLGRVTKSYKNQNSNVSGTNLVNRTSHITK